MKKSFLNEVITENSERDVNDSFVNFLHGFKKMKSINESFDDKALSTDLILFIESDINLNGQIPFVKKTLLKHWKKGEYNTALAERAWGRIVSEAAQQYATEIGKESRLWEQLFPASIRSSIVEGLEQEFYTALKKGKVNMEELFDE